MSNIQTNFRAQDMIGAKKPEVKKVAPVEVKKNDAPKPAPVVLEPVVAEVKAEVVVEELAVKKVYPKTK